MVLAITCVFLVSLLIGVSSLADEADNAYQKMVGAFIEAEYQGQLEKGPIDFWTIEERFAFEQPWIDLRKEIIERGDDPFRTAFFGLPDEADIGQDAAQELAMQAVKDEFGEKAFDDSRMWDEVSVYFWDYFAGEKENQHEWRFIFYSRAAESKQESIPYYEAWIDAKTGNVNKVFIWSELDINPER
jgi:hypothetical protein